MIELSKISHIAATAGEEILKVYNSDDFETELKSDNSPLTKADKISHEIISEQLKKLIPDLPVFSEEGGNITFEERKSWKQFWCVDPLDGTKEFIKRNGEFTVNIALIENAKPVLGVIFVPVSGETYLGSVNEGSYKITRDGSSSIMKVSNKSASDELTVVKSRSHSGSEEEEFYSQYKIDDRISKGSSLKICMVAEGKADLYFRGGPTWEWDTAAGHAILNAAGGYFVNKDHSPVVYNKEIPKNFGFIASSFEIT